MNDKKAFDYMFNKAAAALVMVCERDAEIKRLKDQITSLRANLIFKDMKITRLEARLPDNTTQEETE